MLLAARQLGQLVADDEKRGKLALPELCADVAKVHLHIKLWEQAGLALLDLRSCQGKREGARALSWLGGGGGGVSPTARACAPTRRSDRADGQGTFLLMQTRPSVWRGCKM